jgi:hypothetical protein
MRSIDDAFLTVIAHQTRVTTATQQLKAYHHALARWQAYAIREIAAADSARVQYELAYYRQQIARWQNELRRLTVESRMADFA